MASIQPEKAFRIPNFAENKFMYNLLKVNFLVYIEMVQHEGEVCEKFNTQTLDNL